MDDLIKMIKEELEPAEKDEVVEVLQRINEKFLKEYHLDVGGFILEPLVIETYFHKDGVFCDGCVHAARNENGKMAETARKRQKKNFGKLYIHNVINKDDGLDICLSDGDYYYSVLIKNAILNGEKFATQDKISVELCSKCKKCTDVDDCIYNDTIVLKRNKSKNLKTVHSPRKGVPNRYKLAAFSLEAMKKYPLTIEGGKGAAVIEYIKKHNSEFKSNEEKIQFAKEYANYCPEAIKNGEV